LSKLRSDVLIKTLRTDKGLTQDQLCLNICTKDTLSRIERSLHIPTWYIFEKLMLALGENPYKYQYAESVITIEDKRIVDSKANLKSLLQDNNEDNNDKAERLIAQLEKDKSFNKEDENRSFLWRQKATLAFNRKRYDEAKEYAFGSLKISRLSFDESKINEVGRWVLSLGEIWAINQIASIYLEKKMYENALVIFLGLKESIDNGYLEGDEKIRIYISILYNITTSQGLLKKHKDCLPFCDMGIELCTKYQYTYCHPLFLFNKSYNLLYLERFQEAESYINKAFSLFYGLDRHLELESGKNFLKKEFGNKISFFEF